jgi:hypothetical protein
MTKLLENLFELNVPTESQSESVANTELPLEDIDKLISPEVTSAIDRVQAALPQVVGLDSTDNELDEHRKTAEEAFNNLMDLGFNVDSRFSAEIFSVAATMKSHALNATVAKINRKLKSIDLQLKQAELERKLAAQDDKKSPTEIPLGQANPVDRNDLVKMFLAQTKSSGKDK